MILQKHEALALALALTIGQCAQPSRLPHAQTLRARPARTFVEGRIVRVVEQPVDDRASLGWHAFVCVVGKLCRWHWWGRRRGRLTTERRARTRSGM